MLRSVVFSSASRNHEKIFSDSSTSISTALNLSTNRKATSLEVPEVRVLMLAPRYELSNCRQLTLEDPH